MQASVSLRFVVWFFVVTIIIASGVFFRMYPVTVHPQVMAKVKAEIIVMSRLQKKANERVHSMYPDETVSKSSEIEASLMRGLLLKNRREVQDQIRTLTKLILKSDLGPQNVPYLLGADSYYYLDLTRRVIETGHLAEKIDGHRYFNARMLAPSGFWYPWDLHPFVGSAIYKVLCLFQPGKSLNLAASLTPLVLMALTVIPFLMLVSRGLSLSILSSSVGGLFLVLCPFYIKRSLFGWYDTDPYNVLFPSLIILFLILGFGMKSTLRKSCIYASAAAIATILYAFFWRGWLLVWLGFAFSLILAVLLQALPKIRNMRKQLLVPSLLYLILPPLFFVILWGKDEIASIGATAFGLVSSFFSPGFSLWPDIFLAVGELKPQNLNEAVSLLGGFLFFIFSFLGILARVFQNFRSPARPCRIPDLLVLIIFILTTFTAIKVQRLTLFLVLPLAIGSSLAVHQLNAWLEFLVANKAPSAYAKLLRAGLVWVIPVLFVVILVPRTHAASMPQAAIFNSSWDAVMEAIKKKTHPDTIVTSWWPPGHFITSQANRRVTFDGATQNTPQAYWVANLLLESSEEKALGILRMLNTSGNKATEFLMRKMKLSEAVGILHLITQVPRSEAENALKNVLDENDRKKLLELTHGESLPPSVLFIYNELVKNAMGLEYVGRWDFSQAEAFQKFVQEKPEKLNPRVLKHGSTDYAKLQWSFSGGPLAQGSDGFERSRLGNRIRFTNGVDLDIDTISASFDSKKFGKGRPKYLYYMEGEEFRKKELPQSDSPLSILWVNDGVTGSGKQSYRTIIADERLIESLLFRLHYLKGKGLKRIHLLHTDENVDNRTRLYVFQVNWDARGQVP